MWAQLVLGLAIIGKKHSRQTFMSLCMALLAAYCDGRISIVTYPNAVPHSCVSLSIKPRLLILANISLYQ